MVTFIINSILLGAGLAMDAFSVSLANGLAEPNMGKGRMSAIAGVFGGFQAVMPLAGWICVHSIASTFEWFQNLIPWIALLLLAYIGGKMLIEGIRDGAKAKAEAESEQVTGAVDGLEEKSDSIGKVLDTKTLMIQGVATSIDALSVGFAIASYNLAMAVGAVLLIGLVTYIICMVGLALGRKAGTKLAGRAGILGGIILIGIGIEIFIAGI